MGGAESDKQWLREELLSVRRARSADALAAARAAVREHVLSHVEGTECVAAYVPLRTEPGSPELLADLRERGVRVLVPRTLPDRDLDWTEWFPERIGPPLGVAAIASAALVLAPALAVARDGTRLGRGGGSYDRALRRRNADAVVAALVFADEVVEALPRDSWDVPVAHAVTPDGWQALAGNPDFPLAR